MSGNDFWTSGTGTGNGKFHSHFSGTGIQVENSNPIFGNGNGNENSIKFHSLFREREWEWKIPFPTFGTGIGGRYSREFPGSGIPAHGWDEGAGVELEGGGGKVDDVCIILYIYLSIYEM